MLRENNKMRFHVSPAINPVSTAEISTTYLVSTTSLVPDPVRSRDFLLRSILCHQGYFRLSPVLVYDFLSRYKFNPLEHTFVL